VSSSGFISLFGKNCFVGEGFAERDVALERDDKTGVIGVRYANMKLGDLADSPNARLPPNVGGIALAQRSSHKLTSTSVNYVPVRIATQRDEKKA
jgi:hypothetical protein